MKVEFFESAYGADITLIPETIEEASALARMTLNAKAVKPEIKHYFSDTRQSCNIWIKSVSEKVRHTLIKNNRHGN